MPRLLILGEPFPWVNPIYRGTYRHNPYHIDSLPDDHEVNRMFFWFCEEGGEVGVVHSLAKAQRLVQAYRQIDPPQFFEVVEVLRGTETPEVGTEFLGIDLSAEFNCSLLASAVVFHGRREGPEDDGHLPCGLSSLLRLLKAYFAPRLNGYGLFTTQQDASFCLECMIALQRFYPGLWESPEVNFECLGLYLVHR